MTAAGGGAARAFPWEEAFAFVVARLRLSPRQFWAMTPRELAMAMRAAAPRAQAPGRAALDDMMARFPDA